MNAPFTHSCMTTCSCPPSHTQAASSIRSALSTRSSSNGGASSQASASRGKRPLPTIPVGAIPAAIASGRPKRGKQPPHDAHSSSIPPPSSAAFKELCSRNVTILRKEMSPSECNELLESATREKYVHAIGGDQRRKFAINAAAAPLASRILERVRDCKHMCMCICMCMCMLTCACASSMHMRMRVTPEE